MEKHGTQQDKFPIKASNVLQNTMKHLMEGITGIASSKREEWVLSAGYILQRLTTGRFLEALTKEWEKFREQGRIKDDYESTEQYRTCLQELLDCLDKDLPDEERFRVLKQIFLVAATEDASNRDSHLPLQYMQICRTLTAGEVLVLNTTYSVTQRTDPPKIKDSRLVKDWLQLVAIESGLKFPELVETHEKELMKKNLLSERGGPSYNQVLMGSHLRLTDLGYEICEYINHYTP